MSTQHEPPSASGGTRPGDDLPIPDLGDFFRRANSWFVALSVTACALIVIGVLGEALFLTERLDLGTSRFEVLLIALAPGALVLGVLGVFTWLAVGATASLRRRG